jgi:hypothetical protein
MTQKNYVVQGNIPPHRIVKFGSVDRSVVLARDPNDSAIGVTGRYKGNAVAGERVDVIRDGLCEVEYGGTVTRGQALTADANGKAIAATVTGARIVGYAEESAIAGDIGWMTIELGVFVGSGETLPALGATEQRLGKTFSYPVFAGQAISQGSLVVMYGDNVAMRIIPMSLPPGSVPLPVSTAYSLVPNGYQCVGVATESVDNSAGSAGAVSVNVKRGCFKLAKDGSIYSPITLAYVGKPVFTNDGYSVSLSPSPDSVYVGVIRDVEADGVWVEI